MSEEDKMEKKRYYNVDFLRIAFVVLIVYYHFIRTPYVAAYNIPLLENLAQNAAWTGTVGNAILFVISGFFLFPSLLKQDEPFLKFAIRKLMRFWPVLCFAVASIGILSLFNLVNFDVGQNVLNIFLITAGGGGLTNKLTNLNVTWFVCALFWCSLFYCALFKVIKDRFKFNFVVVIISYFNLVIYLNSSLRDYQVIHGVFSRAGAVAMALIGVGILLNQLYNQINWDKIKTNTIFLTLLEAGLIIYLAWGCIFKKFKETYMVMLIASVALFILFLINKGYIARFLNKPIFSVIGKYAFAIYIMQEVSFVFYKNYIWNQAVLVTTHPILTIFISLFLSITLGVFTYHLIEDPCAKFLKKKLLDNYDSYIKISGGVKPLWLLGLRLQIC
ncbi:acyltransferase [bacterium]|nr:acyltransferase [bacterium]